MHYGDKMEDKVGKLGPIFLNFSLFSPRVMHLFQSLNNYFLQRPPFTVFFRIDDIEDEIYREKLKIKRCSDELDETFDDMIEHY